jgi:hypothetical protein
MGTNYEKEFNDDVYEDEFYDEMDEDEEELADVKDAADEQAEEEAEAWDSSGEKRVDISFACEECDYRWDDVIIKKEDDYEHEEIEIVCPMCGTTNVTQI